ncbi:C-type lectin lectoxin-Thr1 [Lingula anatina]|uniref:C-type lectin lectoxin-Thr1 n=1 Tax=Lingula anatina TaxID=7574 RepID=A0A1S3JNU4_LINAN|nr:C-type lectin lectoxin-Thr1 [Lingula anatina]|eukprot:XP_013412038.1 C-type lectin lectoxin-Thr1 [Lingula anatina]
MNQNSETELRATLATIQQQNLLLQNRLDEQDRKLNCIFKECPYSFVRNNCSCYKVINRTATWNDARYSCSTMGAHLVHVQNAEEQQTIGRQVASHYFEGDGFVSNQGFWLGGYDLKPPNTTVGVDGVWTWETTNQNLTYFNWSEGEPNNWGGTDEDCLLMTYNIGYTWNDDICTNTHVYICEIDLV